MEVSGKKLCKPCLKQTSSTYTDRFCLHCEEEMCQSCFDTHVQFKVSREHRLVKSFEIPLKRAETPTLDNCTKHLNEAIKFFCPEHSQVGCADCMIISHKNCKIEYILEGINDYKDSEESKRFKKDIEKYDSEAKAMLESIKCNKVHVTDVNNKFVRDVNLFRDEMISHITHLAETMLQLGNKTMREDKTNIENLEEEIKSLVDETTKMKDKLQSEADQPYKLFITTVSYKQKPFLAREQLRRIKEMNTARTYTFENDCHLEQLVKNCKELGSIQGVNILQRGITLGDNIRSASNNVPTMKNRKALYEVFTSSETTECFRCLSKDKKIQDLKVQLKSIVQLTESLDDLQRRYDKLERRFHEEVRLKDDALLRLCKGALSKLRDNSADKTDLSNQTRPTKVAKKLSELFDNQWTDAFDILEQQMEEKQVIHTLLKILMTAFATCQELSSRHFFERVQKAIELPTEVAEISNYQVVLSDQLKQEIKEFRKNRAPFVIRDVEKAVRPRLPLAKNQSKDLQEYVTACVEIAWLCAVQDPPLELDAKFTDKFKTNVLKDYTKRGEFVDFVVWPAMFLYKGGPLLSKGVAQGRCDNKPREVPDRPISADTRKGGYNTQTGTYTHSHFSNQQTEQYQYRDHQSYQRPGNRNQHHYNKSKTTYAPSRTNAQNDYDRKQRYPTHSTEI